MMDQKRALTIPFSVNKDNEVNLVSWPTLKGSKFRNLDSPHINGSTLFEQAAMIALEMNRRKARLVLTDVLKTDAGITYLERMKRSYKSGVREQMSTQRDGGCSKEKASLTRSGQDELKWEHRSPTPKHSQKSTASTHTKSKFRRKLDLGDKEEKEEIPTNGEECRFAEVVDCGLSVRWQPDENIESYNDFSPTNVKDKWTDPENIVKPSLHKRKRTETKSYPIGFDIPKRHRTSVLRFTGEDGSDGGPVPVSPEEALGNRYLDMLDSSIMKFTVGGDDTAQVLVPVIDSNLEFGNLNGSLNKCLSTAQEREIRMSGCTEPIVLSSDDEESSPSPESVSTLARPLVAGEDELLQGQMSHEAVTEPSDSALQDVEVVRVIVEDPSDSEARVSIDSVDNSCMDIAFSTLHCGGYRGKANGDMMMREHHIIIPLRDTSDQVDVVLTFEREALRKYSIWDEQDMEMQGIFFQGDEELSPPSVLLLCVSDNAACALQHDLCKLSIKKDANNTTGQASPIILLTLKKPQEGLEGAFLRSFLDIDCLKGLTHEPSLLTNNSDRFSFLEDVHAPFLSLEDSIKLIRRIGRDLHLLSLLGLEDVDDSPSPKDENNRDNSRLDKHDKNNRDDTQGDKDKEGTLHKLVEVTPQRKSVLQLETAAEQDAEMQLKPEETHEEQEPEQPPEKKALEPTPVYTLCHCRTKGSYSVSMCKPDSSWTKYKHQGLARRLIQFPPPPLKGGITVTMEDLQCLDNGQFLNDVIIDFYLKYLLHNASTEVAERIFVFSSFFYKQLTRRDNASEGGASDSCQKQRRHQRVKTWTRHVDIFNKDFVFVPVNQESHWYLVVICFPGLDKPTLETWNSSDSQETDWTTNQNNAKSPSHNPKTSPTVNNSDIVGSESEKTEDEVPRPPQPGPVNCTEKTFQKKTVCKRPCILIMDSLKLSLHERVVKLLRDYLQSEWEVRRCSTREFGPDQMKSSHCQVPLQDNSSDCGLYLLHYVESFLKDPVVHFDLPLQLQRWFPRQQVRRKRDQIRDLVLYLFRQQNLNKNR